MLDNLRATLKSGEEKLFFNEQPTDFSLLDFWRWSVSDILSNATRGRFAEFIVATAIGMDRMALRDEWSAYDLETTDGIKLEIKSAAYLQSWNQKALSKITFSTKAAFHWDEQVNTFTDEKKRHADVYVFCLLKHEDKQTVDPLNLDQWAFYVLATRQLNDYTRSQHSITLKSLQNLTPAIIYDGLKPAIAEKHRLNTLPGSSASQS